MGAPRRDGQGDTALVELLAGDLATYRVHLRGRDCCIEADGPDPWRVRASDRPLR